VQSAEPAYRQAGLRQTVGRKQSAVISEIPVVEDNSIVSSKLGICAISETCLPAGRSAVTSWQFSNLLNCHSPMSKITEFRFYFFQKGFGMIYEVNFAQKLTNSTLNKSKRLWQN
jgi:hypothetical protein